MNVLAQRHAAQMALVFLLYKGRHAASALQILF